MNPKNERTILVFITLFLLIMLISNIVNYITGAGSSNIWVILCFAGGLICTVIGWIQHFRNRKTEE